MLTSSSGYATSITKAGSLNVTDGILRLEDDTETVTVALSSTAYRFAPGHRLRLQVSGGAFPAVRP